MNSTNEMLSKEELSKLSPNELLVYYFQFGADMFKRGEMQRLKEIQERKERNNSSTEE
jgi:hypothetical protein